jgi:hypothetical protein
MIELTMNTITAETTIGSQSDRIETAMSTSFEWVGYYYAVMSSSPV